MHATNTQLIFFAIFVALCFATNALWYRAKLLLRARGFPISWVRYDMHWQDLRHLAQLGETDPSCEERERFRRLRTLIVILFVASLSSFAVVFLIQVLRVFGRA